MPEIPEEALAKGGKFLKPASMGFTPKDIGKRVKFTITAPHSENKQGTNILRSIPVSYKEGTNTVEGQFPLNKTALAYLVKALGSNSDKWVKASFEAVVLTQNNPQTSQQVLSWTIVEETIIAPK